MIKSNFNFSKKYQTRYINPITNEIITTGCKYLKNGKSMSGRMHYLVGKEWLTQDNIPEYREYIKNKSSCFEGFLPAIKKRMVFADINFDKRSLIGKNEFEDSHGCHDKIKAHYKRQLDEFGPYCPITGIKLTFIRKNEKTGKGKAEKVSSNISPDRLLNNLRYTEKNLLFTTAGWNLLRRDFSLKDMAIYIPKLFFKNYTRILLERFPEKQDEVDQLNELENGAEHPQERR
tara:strand:+ start:61 stop:756 length:696 start_codon:yes stop_codon:yes gene_type:complete